MTSSSCYEDYAKVSDDLITEGETCTISVVEDGAYEGDIDATAGC
jgi:hypothetical protein